MESCFDGAHPSDMPLVSVVVPVYNKRQFLGEALRSFDRQTYGRVEWILVDDGSTDGSGGVLSSWVPRSGESRVVSKENGGASSARNEGLRRARGEFALFWDADDLQDPRAIERMVAAAACEHVNVVVSAIRRIRRDGSELDLFTCEGHAASSERAIEEWLRGGVSTGPYSKLVRTSLLRDRSISFEEGVINEDVMWTAELLGAAGTVYFIGEPLYHYVERPGSVALTTSLRLLDVFDNCSKLESYIGGRFPNDTDACAEYCAGACLSVILAAARGNARRAYPDLYARSMRELAERRADIRRFHRGIKDRIRIALVELGLYGHIMR